MDIEIITDVQGLAELEEAFTGGSERAVRKFLRAVELKAAKVLRVAASEEAPYRDGDLAADIHSMTVNTGDSVLVRTGPSQETFHGMIQEFGAPEANVPAQHWLEMSAKGHENEVLEEYHAGLTAGLEDMKK